MKFSSRSLILVLVYAAQAARHRPLPRSIGVRAKTSLKGTGQSRASFRHCCFRGV